MTFTPEQTTALKAKLDPRFVAEREQAGRKLSYIEGWHAIAEANRIFGFDAWDRETVETICVWSGERKTRSGDKPAASYIARVRVRVRAGDRVITREGTGAGSGFGNDHGEAHESAIKEAETDAMKRALMTFGNPFGLALYDKTQSMVGVDVDAPVEPGPIRVGVTKDGKPDWQGWAGALKARILNAVTVDEVNAWINENNGPLGNLLHFKKSWHDALHKAADERRAEFAPKQAAE